MREGTGVRAKVPTLKSKLCCHEKPVTALTFATDSILFSGSADGTVRRWNLETNQPGATFKPKAKTAVPVTTIALSPDGHTLVSGHEDGQLHLWNVHGGPASCKLAGHLSKVSALMFMTEGQRIISGSSDGTVVQWSADTGKRIKTLASGSEGITALALAPDNTLLAIATDNGVIQVLNLRTEAVDWEQNAHEFWAASLAFSPNSNALVSGGYDQMVRVWAAQTGFKVQAMRGHSGCIGTVAYEPIASNLQHKSSGRLIASGSYDGSVRLWDSWTGELAHTLADHGTTVASVAFAPVGNTLATTAREEIWLWGL